MNMGSQDYTTVVVLCNDFLVYLEESGALEGTYTCMYKLAYAC